MDASNFLTNIIERGETNDAKAQSELGHRYFYENDYEQAIKWLKMAAEQNDADAQWLLGGCYCHEYGIKEDHEQAEQLFIKSAEKGNVSALDCLGCFYSGKKLNLNKAFEYYSRAAMQGHVNSQYQLGKFYCHGVFVKEDKTQAIEWFKKSAEQGNADAQFCLGQLYVKTKGDYKLAIKWYKLAAEQGLAKAQYTIGILYYYGSGVKRNYKQAVNWWTKSAEQGDDDAQCFLGMCYDAGKGVKKDYEKAIIWLTKAAEQNNVEAQSLLGEHYYRGKGVKKDYEQAVKWLKKAAEHGDAFAQMRLGFCLQHGNGVVIDNKQAVNWLAKAAEQGVSMAQACLGCCYMEGKGTMQDSEQAIMWHRKAAEQGIKCACFFLGEFYYHGTGVEQDLKQAEKWYEKVVEQDVDSATKQLTKIAKEQLINIKEGREHGKRLFDICRSQLLTGNDDITDEDFSSFNGEEIHNTILRIIKEKISKQKRSEVFISYSHKDKKQLEELQVYLRQLKNDGITVWYDDAIKSGDKWKQEIKKHISMASIAILMVSPSFLTSDFILNEELPDLLHDAEDEKVRIMWLPIRHSSVKDYHIKGKNGIDICIADYHAVFDIAKPLAEMKGKERDRVFLKLYQEIKEHFQTRDNICHR